MFASKDTLLTRPSGYNIARSVRTRASASAYLNRTPATTSNSQKFTLSTWVKRGKLGVSQVIYAAGNSAGAFFDVQFTSGDLLRFDFTGVGATLTNAVYRDPAAWYHIVVAVDTTQATSTNRALMYVNGVLITSYSQYNVAAQNATTPVNTASSPNYLGCYDGNTSFLDGYQTEVQLIDGQQLTPSSFGSTNAITGVWQPAKYTGTYGTNGFYLNFSDNSNNTAATIGKDYSGNGNNWTPNNISVTAGVTYDSMTDVPTLTSATASNYCVMNPLRIDNVSLATGTISDGNLKVTTSTTTNSYSNQYGTMGFSTSGKWYFEAVYAGGAFNGAASNYAGIVNATNNSNGSCTLTCGNTITIQKNFTNVQTGLSFAIGDILGVAFDATNLTVDFYKNGSALGTQVTGLNSGEYTPFILAGNGSGTQSSWTLNFGQRPFSYTPPTGFVALNTFNLPASTITNGAAYMAATLYTGNSSTQTITNTVGSTSFKPDFVWIKNRTTASQHVLTDSVRGVTKQLFSSNTNAEQTSATGITSLNSNGFSLDTNVSPTGSTNSSPDTYVAWNWNTNGGSTASNTNGSITSTVSVGATQGFSVVTWTGTGSVGTIGHGLGSAPKFIISKSRSTAGTNWNTYSPTGVTNIVYLNSAVATTSQPNVWNSTAPTSSVFTVGTDTDSNGSGRTMVAYCWSEVAGYSAFGSYTGNGSSDGPFVYTGFRPRWVMIKASSNAYNWYIYDSSRNTYNLTTQILYPNSSSAEVTGVNSVLDFLSNGFKIRDPGAGELNTSSSTFIYACFAESPFKTSLAR